MGGNMAMVTVSLHHNTREITSMTMTLLVLAELGGAV